MKNVSKKCNIYKKEFFSIILNRIKFIKILMCNIFSFEPKNLNLIYYKYIYEQDVFREERFLYRFYEANTQRIEKEKYIYFPLHLQPEATTSPMGGRYWDQLMCIKMLSYYLPDGYYVYVKEHPSQIRGCLSKYKVSRSVNFYEQLLALKNVKLISFEEDTYGLIKNSIAVATVTGRVGFEAIINSKPCMVFGKCLLNYADGVIEIISRLDCKNAIDKIINNRFIVTSLKDLKIYIKFLEVVLYKGTIHPATENDNLSKIENDSLVANAYKKKIDELFQLKYEVE